MTTMRLIPAVLLLLISRLADAAQTCPTEGDATQSCLVEGEDQQLQEEEWDEERDHHVLLLQSEFSLKQPCGPLCELRKRAEVAEAAAAAAATTMTTTTATTTTTRAPDSLLVLEAVNNFLAKTVTPKLTSGLSALIKENGDDPMASVANLKGLDVVDLTGLSTLNVSSLTVGSIGLGISLASGTSGSVTLSTSASVPTLQAKAQRFGLLGKAQAYGLSIPGVTFYATITGIASMVNNSLAISAIQVQALYVNIPGISVDVQHGERYVEKDMSAGLNAHKGSMATAVANKLKLRLQERFDKLLPIPLNLTLLAR